ncbi:MAG TPA: DUF349 domain-containing protein [Acidobacteria bacterium]|nr:DUF349 domain-containing protein [Acidobacteriota bacterium]
MSLLDRLRGQPEWQHADPSVRSAAVDDLDDDAQELLLAIATEDADPGVRSAAVMRLTAPAVLGSIAVSDQDDGVRTDAVAALREMAVGGTDTDVARAALSGLSEPRDLGEVARVAALESVSLAALERLDAQKTLSAVSRRSAHPVVRQAALARVTDGDELLAVAVKSDHRDIALAAFERVLAQAPDDRERLKTVAARARVKPVARRAKAALVALDTEPVPPPSAGRRQQRERLCESVEALTGTTNWDLVRQSLTDAEREWSALDAVARNLSAPPSPAGTTVDSVSTDKEETDPDPAVAERWASALAQVAEHVGRLDTERGQAEGRRETQMAALAARTALCERLSGLVSVASPIDIDADELVAGVAAIRAEWTALAVVSSSSDEDPPDDLQDGVSGAAGASQGEAALNQIQRRFNELLTRVDGVVQNRQSAGERGARLTELVAALEEISGTAAADELKRRWAAPHAEWRELVRASEPLEVADLVTRVAGAAVKRAERLETMREARLKREQANLLKQQRRCEELEQAVADETLELPAAERELRRTRSLLGNLGRLPREGREALTPRLREVQTGLTGRVRELRGLVEWKQWANLSVQASLCHRLEALAAVEDDAAVANEYKEVMLAWRQASEVQPGEGDEIWKRFKVAHDAIRPRAEAHLARQDTVRQENLAKKIALCEEAERLAASTDWIATAQRMTQLQADWKQVGPATRKQERDVWNRFRAACGEFFTRRRDDLTERKQVWSKNAALKEALSQRAEALSDESDLVVARETVRRLQAEWKTVGPVRRARSEALWKRFRAACDQVYSRSQQATAAEFEDKLAARTTVCERLEGLTSDGDSDAGEPPEGLKNLVATIRTDWRQLPPVPRPQEGELTARFQSALARVVERYPAAFAGSDLDPERNRAALERLCERVEARLDDATTSSASDDRSPAEVLAAQLREALASNTMGARVDPAVQARTDIEEVKRLQIERRSVGSVPGESGQQLSDRFRTACDRFFQQHPPSADRASRPRQGGARSGRARRPESGARGRA